MSKFKLCNFIYDKNEKEIPCEVINKQMWASGGAQL